MVVSEGDARCLLFLRCLHNYSIARRRSMRPSAGAFGVLGVPSHPEEYIYQATKNVLPIVVDHSNGSTLRARVVFRVGLNYFLRLQANPVAG